MMNETSKGSRGLTMRNNNRGSQPPKRATAKTRGTGTRRLRYSVAMSLDGFIAGSNGEFDWILMDPAFDFAALCKQFDTLLMGRRTFELVRQSPAKTMTGMETVVFSRTLKQSDYPGVTITANLAETVSALKSKAGKDLWLFGGGELFRGMLDANLVDTIEVAVMPILLSQGVPLLPAGARSPSLRLSDSSVLPSGTVMLTYALQHS
jgi:dihydrofolate reductase